MSDWYLTFRETQPITVEACERLLSAFVGAPVTTVIGETSGNPRDYYSRRVEITATGGELRIELGLLQQERGPDDPEASTSLADLTLRAPAASFATKLAAWHALRDAFAKLGCIDRTLVSLPAPIVDDAVAAGEAAIAARLRADVTAALVAEAAHCRFHVSLRSPRADDLEAILSAYPEPAAISGVSLDDCELIALPAGLARFPNVETLSLVGNKLDVRELSRLSLAKLTQLSLNGIDGSALRGLSLPTLTMLVLAAPGLRTLRREDLDGFPNLATLILARTQLEELDPDIIDGCPKLRRIMIVETPLAGAAEQLAVLRARWPDAHFRLSW